MQNALHNKKFHVKDSIKNFNELGCKNFLDIVIDSKLQLILRKLLPLSFAIVAITNSHNYMKKLLKYSSLVNYRSL